MEYLFTPHLLLRMPVRAPADHTRELNHFLNDPLFRAAIRLASPDLFEVVKRHSSKATDLSIKETNALWKYINRYCFRPTPFGLFSSVSLINWSEDTAKNIDHDELTADLRPAMPVQIGLGDHLIANKFRDQARFESNPSLYRVMNELRFFRTGLDETGQQREYQLQSITYSKLLKDLINYCRTPRQRTEICLKIERDASASPDIAADYTDFLIDAQFLVSTARLAITGPDHLERSRDPALSGHPTINVPLRSLDEHRIQEMEDQLRQIKPELTLPRDKISVILKSQNFTDLIPSRYQETLRSGIHALAALIPHRSPPNLVQFVRSYLQHFEGRTLPLLTALDPEAGIGYQEPETEKNNPLLETLNIPYTSTQMPDTSWTDTHSVLMSAWLRNRSSSPVIRLIDKDLESARPDKAPPPLLGMSVLFRITGDQVFIENAGGINAPALMGRFTLTDEKIAGSAKAMARQLEAQHPDLIFAELLHLADPHTDNINRRASIYHYELPVMAASTLPAEQQLQLEDLFVRIVNHKVMLFSEKHQKYVIPRLSSAYNHSLNRLPLFRFLADLPYQYARADLSLNLRQLFPGLSHYPRIEYQKVILGLATWLINAEQIAQWSAMPEQATSAFRQWRSEAGLPRHFSLSEGDQDLVFDVESDRDLRLFQSCIRQKKEVILKESLPQRKVRQYNAYLLPAAPLRLPKFSKDESRKQKAQRKYVPGSSWLYLKVYAPRIGVDRLLLQLYPLLSRTYAGHKIGRWFFVRYEDHAPHIRLRLQIDPASVTEVLVAFKNKLEDRIQQQVIREFQIDVYSRELERYASAGIENTEHFFYSSSELVLRYLKRAQKGAASGKHLFALYSIHAMICHFITDQDARLEFALTSYQQFLPEFATGPVKVALDKKYRELADSINAAFRAPDPSIYGGSVSTAERFLASLGQISRHMGGTRDDMYVRSIIHLHLNRIFTDESRKQEMICYYMLYKYLRSVRGRTKGSVTNGLS